MASIPVYPYGYKLNFKGNKEVEESKAEVVRIIYQKYLEGMNRYQITWYLVDHKILRPRGDSYDWQYSMVNKILMDERYAGNERYPAILSEEVFSEAQARRKGEKEKYLSKLFENCNRKRVYPFSGFIICESCGSKYIRGIQHTNAYVRKATWRCRNYKLKNEGKCKASGNIYEEHALLQKSYTVDFLNKKRVKNDGYVQKYYVENSHEPIISKEDFAAVQAEFARRNSLRGFSKTGKSEYSSKLPFSGKIYCNCGAKFNRSQWGTGKYKRPIWTCINHKTNGDKACPQKSIVESNLERAFINVINQVIGGKESFINQLFENIYKGIDKVKYQYSANEIAQRLEELQQDLMSLVRLNAKTGLDTRAYDVEYNKLAKEIERFREMKKALLNQETHKTIRIRQMEDITSFLNAQTSPVKKFDGELFRRLVDKVKVKADGNIAFVFKTGIEVEVYGKIT